MALHLRLERNVLRYHLDRLKEAKLVDTAGANARYGTLYWDLTAEGRRYVVERKLA
jgi:DNA-binding transcriptional ArsR family regulator